MQAYLCGRQFHLARLIFQLNAWCELAKQDDIKSANWFGATWPGQPPPPFLGQTVPPPNPNADQCDEGYGSQAIGFRVTKVTLLLHPNVHPSNMKWTIG